MSIRGEVLVAIMNDPADLAIARDQHWYRIPLKSVERFLKDRWPPERLGFYQTQIFEDEAYSVRYSARVLKVSQVSRQDLFPNEVKTDKSERSYYKLDLAPLESLPRPILSRRLRRIVFIPTTLEKLAHATEINDLYDDSPLEDRLWAELKLQNVPAERQEFVKVKDDLYALDFAVYCASGKLDIETDGDVWHSNPKRTPLDNRRQNDLATVGWKVLRFNTKQINEQMGTYCLPTIFENIKNLGGIDQAKPASATEANEPFDWQQLFLFDTESVTYQPKRKRRRK